MNTPDRRVNFGRRESDRIGSGHGLWTVTVGLIIGAQAIAVFVLLGMFRSISDQSGVLAAEQARLKENVFGAVRRCEQLVRGGKQ